MKKDLQKEVDTLKSKYNLTDCGFDTEIIYKQGDLSDLLKGALNKLLPEFEFTITETIKNGRYSASVQKENLEVVEIYANMESDWLPDDFWELFDAIPVRLGLEKRFYSINPMLTGQAVWYICGLEKNVLDAKAERLPVIIRGEDIMTMDLSDYE